MLTPASASGRAMESRMPVRAKSSGPATSKRRQPESHWIPGGTASAAQTRDNSPAVRVSERKPSAVAAHAGISRSGGRRQTARRSGITVRLSSVIGTSTSHYDTCDMVLRMKQALAILCSFAGLLSAETIRTPGLEKRVEILRDRWGVPHIYASTVHDLFFAQGWITARDRLFQIDLWRRAGAGKLAEVLGPSAIERDKLARAVAF